MKSIERRFKNLETKNPGLSSYSLFAQAIMEQNFSEQTIRRQFNKMVDKGDYASSEKKDILVHLVNLSKRPVDDRK